MRPAHAKLTVRRMMLGVAMVGLSLGVVDAVRMSMKSARNRRKAESAERLERRCREIDAMDAATRAREAEAAYDNPYLGHPAWNRRMIPYFEGLKRKYRHAAGIPGTQSLPIRLTLDAANPEHHFSVTLVRGVCGHVQVAVDAPRKLKDGR